jgi:hypothetical protein
VGASYGVGHVIGAQGPGLRGWGERNRSVQARAGQERTRIKEMAAPAMTTQRSAIFCCVPLVVWLLWLLCASCRQRVRSAAQRTSGHLLPVRGAVATIRGAIRRSRGCIFGIPGPRASCVIIGPCLRASVRGENRIIRRVRVSGLWALGRANHTQRLRPKEGLPRPFHKQAESPLQLNARSDMV